MTPPPRPGGWQTEIAEVLEGKRRWAVICADNREVLPAIPAVDATLTDPPYTSATHKGARSSHNDYRSIPIDFAPITDLWFVPALLNLTRRWVVAFCELEMLADYRRAAGDAYVRGGFWHKPDAMPQMTGDRPGQPGEGVAVMHRAGKKRWNGGGYPAFWSYGIERADRCHPTQKNLDHFIKLVQQFSDPDEVIFDPFCGSGTTGAAAIRCGRRFIGVERDPNYAATAAARLAAESQGISYSAAKAGQIALFGALK